MRKYYITYIRTLISQHFSADSTPSFSPMVTGVLSLFLHSNGLSLLLDGSLYQIRSVPLHFDQHAGNRRIRQMLVTSCCFAFPITGIHTMLLKSHMIIPPLITYIFRFAIFPYPLSVYENFRGLPTDSPRIFSM